MNKCDSSNCKMYMHVRSDLEKNTVALLTNKNTGIVLYACHINFNAFKVLVFSFPIVIYHPILHLAKALISVYLRSL